MSISSAMVWDVRPTGSDAACSGGFRGGAFIGAPTTPAVAGAGTGGTVAAGTYYVVVTYSDGLGETVISGQTAVTLSGSTSKFTVTSPAPSAGALTWSAYSATTTGGPYFPISTGLAIGSDLVRTSTPPTSGTQPRGVDYTQQDAAQLNVDNSAVAATTTGANSNTLTFTGGYTPTGADVGNTFRATAGTNITAGTYEITAVTTTTWTVTGSANLTGAGGAGSAVVGKMGGALASVGQAAVAFTSGNSFAVKAGTYAIGNGTANTAGNRFALGNSCTLYGYTSNRYPGNTDTPPVFDAGGASMTVLAPNGNGNYWSNLSVTNSGAFASVTAFSGSGNSRYERLRISGCATAISAAGNSVYADCIATGSGSMGGTANGVAFIRCVQVNPTGSSAFGVGGVSIHYVDCIATGGACGSGHYLANQASTVLNCISYGNTGPGIALGAEVRVDNCIVYGNSGTGISAGGSLPLAFVGNCAVGGNGTNFSTNLQTYQMANCVTLSANPFTNAAGLDFTTNATAGGGALLRALGIPGTLIGLSGTGYRDIGTYQHADAAGHVFTGEF